MLVSIKQYTKRRYLIPKGTVERRLQQNNRKSTIEFLPAATKLGQGNVFTGVCDSVHGGGGGYLPQCMLGCQTPPGADIPPGADTPLGADTPREQTSPREQTPPPGADPLPGQEADASIRSMSSRYASYWNAFLFLNECH